jgi:hypothetical protein
LTVSLTQELLHLRQVNALLKKQTAAAATAAEAAAAREAAARQALRTAAAAAASSSNEVSPDATLKNGAVPTQVRVTFESQCCSVHCQPVLVYAVKLMIQCLNCLELKCQQSH